TLVVGRHDHPVDPFGPLGGLPHAYDHRLSGDRSESLSGESNGGVASGNDSDNLHLVGELSIFWATPCVKRGRAILAGDLLVPRAPSPVPLSRFSFSSRWSSSGALWLSFSFAGIRTDFTSRQAMPNGFGCLPRSAKSAPRFVSSRRKTSIGRAAQAGPPARSSSWIAGMRFS